MSTPVAQSRPVASAPQKLAREAIRNPTRLDTLITWLNADEARIKFGCAKALCLISEEHPDLLYPHFDFFVRLLDHPNRILQWDAAFVLSHLARVDADDRFRSVFGKYFSPVSGPVMITAANVIQGGARIALARPHLAERIACEVLKVAEARYQTTECRNVAIGHAIVALAEMLPVLRRPARVVEFVRRQTRNSRPATRRKAEQFLKSHPGAFAPLRQRAHGGALTPKIKGSER